MTSPVPAMNTLDFDVFNELELKSSDDGKKRIVSKDEVKFVTEAFPVCFDVGTFKKKDTPWHNMELNASDSKIAEEFGKRFDSKMLDYLTENSKDIFKKKFPKKRIQEKIYKSAVASKEKVREDGTIIYSSKNFRVKVKDSTTVRVMVSASKYNQVGTVGDIDIHSGDIVRANVKFSSLYIINNNSC